MHLVVAPWQKVEFKDVKNPRAKYDWKPFVVGDMLHHLRVRGGHVRENDYEVGVNRRYMYEANL